MSQELEPSIIEYARHYGLTQDHRACDPLASIPPLDEWVCLVSVEDPPNNFEVSLEKTTVEGALSTERMFIDADTAKLLASITQPAKIPQRFDEDDEVPVMRRKKLKRDLPLLRSDHESDIHDLLQRFEPDLQNEFLPLESLNEDEDEGFTWPSKYVNLPSEIWKKVTAEKLEIPAEALKHLSKIISQSKIDDSRAVFEIENALFTYKKKILPKPATPPILPMSPPYVPFVPSSEVGHLDLLSEHSSPCKEQLLKIEQKLFAKDAITISRKHSGSSPQSSDPMLLDSDIIGEIFSPLKGIKDQPSSPPDDRLPPQKLKVEVPLVVAEPESHFPWRHKGARVGETLTETIPFLPPPLPDFHDDEIMDEINAFFDDTIKPLAERAERSIEQEQLQEADTTRRVKVPAMNFSLPSAPWNTTDKQPGPNGVNTKHSRLLKDMKTLHFKDHVWLLSGKIERELKWTPFPAALGKVDLHEVIHDDGTLATFVTEPLPIDTSLLTWKPQGLRLFDMNGQNDEEELEEGSFRQETDLQSLIRKRKLELLEDEFTLPEGGRDHFKSKELFKSVGSDSSSCLRSVENFMRLRNGAADKRKPLTYQQSSQSPVIQAPTAEAKIHQRHENISREHESEKRLEPALPDIVMSNKRQSFILSATFLKNRKLVRQIQKLLPAAEFIERDWSLHLQTHLTPQIQKQSQSKTDSDPSADEADILVSPSTGLILTTLQKIKQQALPGHTANSTIRERIRHTAPRYETLIILISTEYHLSERDAIPLARDLDYSDCEAIALFNAFCSGLQDETQAIFVPGGHEELSRWIATMMAKHSASNPNLQLIQDETLWELFLRRAGLNAFAAQAILSDLNQKNMETSGNEDFGLTVFVKMSADERLARFERIFGGRRLLSKINDVLEARW